MLIFRTFHLILRQLNEFSDVFPKGHFTDVDGEYTNIEPYTFLYEGYVKGIVFLNFVLKSYIGERNSKAYGSILDGLFDGHIFVNGTTYTIEKSNKYFKDSDFHSIIYEDKNVKKFRLKRHSNLDKNENLVLEDDSNSKEGCLKKNIFLIFRWVCIR